MILRGLTASFVLVLGVAVAQVNPQGGGYPPGGYPPSYPGQTPYPGRTPHPGRGPGIPIPSRGGKDSKKSDSTQALPSFQGKLKRMDDKSIALEMGDNRVLDFHRTSKTKFFQKGDEVKSPQFQAGDEITIEGTQDPTGYLTAVNVRWENAAKTDDRNPDKNPDKKDG